MPAKVIFLAATVIVAAGIVAYENREQVYEFVDRTRRKVANSLQALAGEIRPHRDRVAMSSNMSFSVSTAYREDENEKREQEARAEAERSFSKEAEAYGFASSSRFYDENNTAAGSVRHRPQFGAVPQASVVFDAATESPRLASPPLTPIKVADFVSRRSSTETLHQEKPLPQTPPAPPPKPQSPIGGSLPYSAEIEAFLNPFTDAAVIQAPVIEETPAPANATSARTASSNEDQEGHILPHPFESSQPYWSIHEWAENTAHTPISSAPSLAGSAAEEIGQPADDVLSDFGSEVESVGSWTEVGSSVSGDDN